MPPPPITTTSIFSTFLSYIILFYTFRLLKLRNNVYVYFIFGLVFLLFKHKNPGCYCKAKKARQPFSKNGSIKVKRTLKSTIQASKKSIVQTFLDIKINLIHGNFSVFKIQHVNFWLEMCRGGVDEHFWGVRYAPRARKPITGSRLYIY